MRLNDLNMADKLIIPIENAPEAVAELGNFLIYWAVLEKYLVMVMGYLLSVDWFKAELVYREFINFSSKISLMRRMNYVYTEPQILKDNIDQLLDKAQTLSGKRNAFVHGFWGVNIGSLTLCDSSSPRNHKKFIKPSTDYTAQDIQNVVENVAKLCLSFQRLLDRLSITFPGQLL